MVNIAKLKGKIIENGLTISSLSESLGVDKSTLYRKIRNKGDAITIKEVDAIVKALHLTPSEAAAIFFSHYVA